VKIQLVSVLVDDPIKAFKFYTEVLGFIERVYMPEARLAIVASPEAPQGAGLLLEPNDNPIAKPFQAGVYQQGLPVIVFGVEDIQKEYERLKKLGVVFRSEPTPQGPVIAANLEDTCGNIVQISQFAPA
jgi:predicted enzyme related to lactoylglutathione lyase